MPRIIARTIADLAAKARTDDELREAITRGFRTARDAGYRPSRENLYAEVSEELGKIAAIEQEPEARERLTRAVELIRRFSDESQPYVQVPEA